MHKLLPSFSLYWRNTLLFEQIAPPKGSSFSADVQTHVGHPSSSSSSASPPIVLLSTSVDPFTVRGRLVCRNRHKGREREWEGGHRRPSGTPRPQEVDRAPQGSILKGAGSGQQGRGGKDSFELNRVFYSTFLYCEGARLAKTAFSLRSFLFAPFLSTASCERSTQAGRCRFKSSVL